MEKINKTIIILLIILIGIYSIHKINSYRRQNTINSVISKLEKYKTIHGKYPINPYTNVKNENWLRYMSDSTGQSYVLAYSRGIMSSNTVRYDSKTKKWEDKFNY